MDGHRCALHLFAVWRENLLRFVSDRLRLNRPRVKFTGESMRYAIFCYQAEGEVFAMSKKQDDAMMVELAATKAGISKKMKFGPSARLMPTTSATTVREGHNVVVLDGPFAETKEQLLGFYVVECATLEEAIEAARALAGPRSAAGLSGALEIRPVSYFEAGDTL
jgi:hypothetical protein